QRPTLSLCPYTPLFRSPPPPGMSNPIFAYGHGSGPTLGCAITGGAFYNPTTAQFPSGYIGDYFFADLCRGWIRRFDPATGIASRSEEHTSELQSRFDLV